MRKIACRLQVGGRAMQWLPLAMVHANVSHYSRQTNRAAHSFAGFWRWKILSECIFLPGRSKTRSDRGELLSIFHRLALRTPQCNIPIDTKSVPTEHALLRVCR